MGTRRGSGSRPEGLIASGVAGARPRSPRPADALFRGSRGWMMAPIDWEGTRPAWSPDGTRLTYASLGSGPSATTVGPLYVIERATGNAVMVGIGAGPSWANDRRLVVLDFRWPGESP